MAEQQKRGPNKIQHPYTVKDIYNEYITTVEIGTPYYVSFDEFLSICNDYYKAFSNALIYKSKLLSLGFRLGTVCVAKRKPKVFSSATLSPDWEATRKYGNGKMIRHINDHTGGFKYRFFWSKKQSTVVNQSMYRLVFSRANKRMLAKAIKTGEYDYLEI
jgi:hypothetical protein